MIKVLNVISDTNVGGAGRVILNYLKYYDKTKFEISVVMPRGSLLKERVQAFGVPVYEIDAMADKSLDREAIGKLKKIIREVNPDIVHTHGSMSGRIAGKQCGKKVIYTRHSAFPVSPRIKKGLGRFINKTINEHYADRIIAVSPATMENLTDGGISKDLIDIVLNGVEPVTPKPEEESQAFKESLGIKDGEFVAGIMARIEDYKGHVYILEAADMLKKEGLQFKIVIAGTGGFEDTVRKKAEEMDLLDKVIFLGFVNDVSSVLSILDVQLNASYGTEATSLALLEGFSMGVPAVVSDYGGNPWLVENGVNGYIFKTKDSAALANCLRKLIENPGVLKDMRENAKRVYKEKFTGEIFARNIEKVFFKTLKGESNG